MEKMNEVGLGCTVAVGVLCRVFSVDCRCREEVVLYRV